MAGERTGAIGTIRPQTRGRVPAIPAAWRVAFGQAWTATWSSRLLILLAGVLAIRIFGPVAGSAGFDPGGVTRPFGPFGDRLLAPIARWDSAWYLEIARSGYGADPSRAAFFPLYPALLRGAGLITGLPLPVAGFLVSLGSMTAGLAVLFRLAELELGRAVAGRAVLAAAWLPTSFFLSAVYSEGLFLLTTALCLYLARTGRWWWAGVAGAAAAATRSGGVLLVVPLLLLQPWDRRAWWRPPRELLAVALVPVGLLAFLAGLGLSGADALAPFRAQEVWMRELSGPFAGLWHGTTAAWDGARQLLSGSRTPVYFEVAAGDPYWIAVQNLVNHAFLGLAGCALVGLWRARVPRAYPAWLGVSVLLPLSTPVTAMPLMSMPRFVAALVPVHLWLGLRLTGARGRVAIGVGAAGLVALTAMFACWRFVA